MEEKNTVRLQSSVNGIDTEVSESCYRIGMIFSGRTDLQHIFISAIVNSEICRDEVFDPYFKLLKSAIGRFGILCNRLIRNSKLSLSKLQEFHPDEKNLDSTLLLIRLLLVNNQFNTDSKNFRLTIRVFYMEKVLSYI